jgi:nitrous oxidase accessory protein
MAGFVLQPPDARSQQAQESETLIVGAGERFATVAEALEQAAAGDTVVVRPGVYRERSTVTKSIVLRGEDGAVLDGEGAGVVLTLLAPAHVSGFTIRGSGRDLSREDAGIMVLEADGVVIENVRLEDVLFGIYVKQSDNPILRGNVITGKVLPVAERGDGIRLWYCQGGQVVGNRLERTRDLVIWFSSNLEVRRNLVQNGRYGLHYMYSDHNRFEENEFRDNQVGAFLMYSADIRFRRNLFAEASGASGIGLGLKDADDIRAEENVFVGNAVGLSLDNAPTSAGVTNRFRRNLIAFNDVGVSLLPSVHSNVFEENALFYNVIPVAVSGGGDALANEWVGNHWTDYAGFDDDADRVGDTPYKHERVADQLYARYPELRVFVLSPAAGALELLGRLFPLLKPQPVVIDSSPRLASELPVSLGQRDLALTVEDSSSHELEAAVQRAGALPLIALAVAAAGLMALAGRRRRWTA